MYSTIINKNINDQISGAYVPPITLRGAPGIGKTSIIRNIAKSNSMELINLSLAATSSEELSGLPNFEKVDNFQVYSETNSESNVGTKWSIPQLILKANKLAESNINGVIILLDDIHEANMGLSPYLYEFLLERKLGDYKLNKKVAIVATMNNSSSANFSGFSSAIINRLMIVDMNLVLEDWFNKHAINYNKYVSYFVKTSLSVAIEPEDTQNPFGTARSIEFLSNTLDGLDDEFISKNIEKIASAFMSKQAAKDMKMQVNFMQRIDFEKMVKDKKVHKIPDEDRLNSIAYSYISRYINTSADGEFLCKLIEKNVDNEIFTGLITAMIFSMYYSNNKTPKNDAHRFILSQILSNDEWITDKSYKTSYKMKESNLDKLTPNMADFIL